MNKMVFFMLGHCMYCGATKDFKYKVKPHSRLMLKVEWKCPECGKINERIIDKDEYIDFINNRVYSNV